MKYTIYLHESRIPFLASNNVVFKVLKSNGENRLVEVDIPNNIALLDLLHSVYMCGLESGFKCSINSKVTA